MIKIDGLTGRQRELLTIMWNIPTLPDLERWISSLEPADQQSADSLSTLLMYEHIDQQLDKSGDFSQAQEILSKF